MPTIVGILTFISKKNATFYSLRVRNIFNFLHFNFHEQLKSHTQLSWIMKKLNILRACKKFVTLGLFLFLAPLKKREGSCNGIALWFSLCVYSVFHHSKKLSILIKCLFGDQLRPTLIFSSPELKAHGWAYRIPVTPASVRRPSSVRPQFQTSSPLKPLGQLNSNNIWRLLRTRERKFVQMVLVTWPRWPPRPYMVKTL